MYKFLTNQSLATTKFFRDSLLAILMMFFTSCMEVEHHVYGSKSDIKIRFVILANHSMVQPAEMSWEM